MCLVDSECKLRGTWRQRRVRTCWVCTTGEPPPGCMTGEACLKMGRSFQWDAGVMLLAASTEGEYVARGQESRALAEVLQLEPPYSAYEPAGALAHTDVVPLRA